jgi:hypothetical protein
MIRRLSSVVFAVSLVLVGYQCSFAQLPSVGAPARDTEGVRFPIADGGYSFLVMEIEVAGRACIGALDTGSTYSVYDTALQDILGESVATKSIRSQGGDKTMELFRSPVIGIAGKRIEDRDGTVICTNLEKFRAMTEQDIRVCVGMDVLKQFVIEIDFLNRSFCLRTDSPRGMRKADRIPIKYFSGTPWIPGRIGAVRGAWFQIDTGCFNAFGLLDKDVFDMLSKRGAIKLLGIDEFATAQENNLALRSGELTREFRVGDCRYKAARFSEGEYCCLGLRFLASHVVTLDFPGNAVYLNSRDPSRATDPTIGTNTKRSARVVRRVGMP